MEERLGIVKENGKEYLLYRAERTVSVCELAMLCKTPAGALCRILGKTYLLPGEWAALPLGRARFSFWTAEEEMEDAEERKKENALPFFYVGCPIYRGEA